MFVLDTKEVMDERDFFDSMGNAGEAVFDFGIGEVKKVGNGFKKLGKAAATPFIATVDWVKGKCF